MMVSIKKRNYVVQFHQLPAVLPCSLPALLFDSIRAGAVAKWSASFGQLLVLYELGTGLCPTSALKHLSDLGCCPRHRTRGWWKTAKLWETVVACGQHRG